MGSYFQKDYETSRAVFRNHLDKVKSIWPNASLETVHIGKEENDNTIDIIRADATSEKDKVALLSSGEHGIEGYAGAACIHLFVEEYIQQLQPETTGICLVHAINPWGMRNFRRVTENNIDLNRNYIEEEGPLPIDVNKKYEKEKELFLPNGKIKDITSEQSRLFKTLTKALAKEGYANMKHAKSMGQYEFERGVYYGGKALEENAQYVRSLQKDLLEQYNQIVHMDWHTALGPSNELTMVVPPYEEQSEDELKSRYPLKNIMKFSDKKVVGDSNQHFYQIQEKHYPDKKLFSALFEFGTFGDDKKAELRELMTIVLENQLYWEGAEKNSNRNFILNEFREMFYPNDEVWQSDVMKEARKAMRVVLGAEKVLPSSVV
ncbi:M14 family metallopeptidase [Oceanobacillus manasiensis]|uniref:M14 family metallopeptidase n=1 Tax=Oceanobacillus manasiensis TaxID=586413 RepID=UPI000AA11656|nr:M14 family metallopeptidase [Oceanobacillus manasiensis]